MVVRALAALVTAVVVGALTPGPAMAVADEPEWHRATCFGGAIDSIELTVQATQRGQAFLTLSGHLDCGSGDKRASFAWAHYESDEQVGTLSRNDLRRYRHASLTPFSEGRYVKHGAVNFMACVVTDYDVVIDCVQVSRDLSAPAVEVTRLLEKDATYSRDVTMQDGDVRPACGGCW
ncbi:hypothetical protein ACTMTJ_27115 [Phytohabitans sp. LJ34]|uniref:hypothetical protein n=1 Tax=Phytohabitans sp. LJ34 TaxID=3452217 RepID=UPI003F8AB0A4